jgi:predicted alpha/beta superfamily hydrolase
MRLAFGAVLLLSCSRPAAAPDAHAPEGRPVTIGTSYTLRSAALNETRRINVYLPEGYHDGLKRFDVLYLLDGGEKEDFHHITGLVALEASLGHARDLIVVGIVDTDRKRDFTYPSSDPGDRAKVPTGGGSAAYRRFLIQELEPYVEARYRTTREKAVIGESLAALFVLETFVREPQAFDDYIAISPSLWWDHGLLATEATARAAQLPAGRRLYIATSADEIDTIQPTIDRLVLALKTTRPAQLTWHLDPRPSETHGTIYQPAAQAALRWMFPGG